MIDRWITDETLSPRFPLYTRANADEVGPDPFSPLGWTLGWRKGCVPGTAGGFVAFGVCRWDEIGGEENAMIFGNWGGYFYNPMSLSRIMGVRMPGATAEAIDQAYFGDHPGVPPYEPDPRDEDEVLSVKLGETMSWVMTTDGFPEMEEWNLRSIEVRRSRPDLAKMSDAALVAYGRSMAPLIKGAWIPNCEIALGASLGPGAVQAVCNAIGRGPDAVRVLAGVGGIDSAEASLRMWDLGRIVAASPALTAQFDDGVEGLLQRLDSTHDGDTKAFRDAFDRLLTDFGHRGPNEWDMRPDSWETKPELALGMVERLRHQSDARSPRQAAARSAMERQALTAELTELTADDAPSQGMLLAGIRSAGIWMALRERGKNALIRLINEAKVAFMELGQRMVDRGLLDNRQAVFMLTDEELDDFLLDPASFVTTIGKREQIFRELHTVDPPYIVDVRNGVPPISQWPKRADGKGAATAKVGEILQGGQGSAGIITGRARIVHNPADPGDLRPDDIMIVHTTDPSWTPLFLSIGGVVCDVGAVGSHAVIVSRELGVPCAVSVVHATERIPDGAIVTLDGAAGTVTIVALP